MAATQIELPFGDSQLQVAVPSERLLGVVCRERNNAAMVQNSRWCGMR